MTQISQTQKLLCWPEKLLWATYQNSYQITHYILQITDYTAIISHIIHNNSHITHIIWYFFSNLEVRCSQILSTCSPGFLLIFSVYFPCTLALLFQTFLSTFLVLSASLPALFQYFYSHLNTFDSFSSTLPILYQRILCNFQFLKVQFKFFSCTIYLLFSLKSHF